MLLLFVVVGAVFVVLTYYGYLKIVLPLVYPEPR